MARQRIMLLYLLTGGGHVAAARAVEQRIKAAYDGDDVEVIPFNAMPPRSVFWDGLFQRGYRFTSNRLRELWVGAMLVTDWRVIQTMWNWIMVAVFWKRIAEAMERYDATKIVFLHCLLIAPTLFAVKRTGRQPDMVTVVLDPFTAPGFWFRRTGGPIVVFSERARREAIERYGMRPSTVRIAPVILKEQFSHPLSPQRVAELKRELGFSVEKRVILLAGGGEGLPRGERFTEELLSSDLDVELAVVCGKDEFMKRNIERIALRYPERRIKVYGFIDFMFELMNVADVIISKGGPATIMEALMLRKPLVVSQYLYGQERGNVDFVTRNRVGFFIDDPREIVEHVRSLVSDPSRYEAYRERIDALALRIGTAEIVDLIVRHTQPHRETVYEVLSPVRLHDVFVAPDGHLYPLRHAFGLIAARVAFESYLRRRKP